MKSESSNTKAGDLGTNLLLVGAAGLAGAALGALIAEGVAWYEQRKYRDLVRSNDSIANDTV